MTTQDRAPGAGRSGMFGPRIAAAVLLALGALLIVSALGVARGGGYSVISPATIPLVVAIGLLVLGAIFALRTTVVPDTDLAIQAADEEGATHWPTVGLAGLLLVAYALALDGFEIGPVDVPGLGYIVATALFLPLTARALGSRAPLRDSVAGLAAAVVIYFGFTEFLGVRLPAGILGPLF
jgi:putative tricarboxylic transport membrane protein